MVYSRVKHCIIPYSISSTNKDFSLQALPEIEENDILAELRKNNFNYRFSGDPSFQLEEERRAEAAEDEEGEDLTYREVNHLGYVVRVQII